MGIGALLIGMSMTLAAIEFAAVTPSARIEVSISNPQSIVAKYDEEDKRQAVGVVIVPVSRTNDTNDGGWSPCPAGDWINSTKGVARGNPKHFVEGSPLQFQTTVEFHGKCPAVAVLFIVQGVKEIAPKDVVLAEAASSTGALVAAKSEASTATAAVVQPNAVLRPADFKKEIEAAFKTYVFQVAVVEKSKQ